MNEMVQQTPEQLAAQRARALLDKLWNDKDVGPRIRKQAKEDYPEIVIPDDTVEPIIAPLRAQNDELKKQLEAIKASLDKRAEEDADKAKKLEEAAFSDKLQNARNQFGLTDEGFDKMVARMKETGNYGDPHAAAAWVVSQNPPPPPTGPAFGPQHLNFAGSLEADERYALLHKDPERYFDSEVRKCLSNPQAYVEEVMGPQYARLAFGS